MRICMRLCVRVCLVSRQQLIYHTFRRTIGKNTSVSARKQEIITGMAESELESKRECKRNAERECEWRFLIDCVL